jgi:hypothetical protein
MAATNIPFPPLRVTDLIGCKTQGAVVNADVSFEILPVDFAHRENPFQAFIFLCRFAGDIDGRDYAFRKCYARGCPHNRCPHVSQAVMIANRYLQRDYRRLAASGITMAERLFSLPEMMVKFDAAQAAYGAVMAIDDYVNLAAEGNHVSAEISLEYVPAVEHFANQKRAQVFLMVDFAMTGLGTTRHIERCLACFPEAAPQTEKMEKVAVANQRLKLIYAAFEKAAIRFDTELFQ